MKKLFALTLAIVLLLSLTGCAGAAMPAEERYETSSSVAYDTGMAGGAYKGEYEWETGAIAEEVEEVEITEDALEYSAGGAEVGTITDSDLPQDGRKIIRNTSLTIETKTFTESVQLLKKAVGEVNGYVEYSSQYTGGSTQNAEYVCRIPAEKYSAFLEKVQGAGSVVNTEESTEDATAQYIDMEARLKSLRTQETRLLEMMEESGTLEELILIQDKLMEVQYQIESYMGQLKSLADRVDYATVRVYLEEVKTYTPVEPSFGDRIARAFSDMLTGVQDGAEYFVLALITLIPLWIVCGVIVVVLVLAVKRKKKKAAKAVQPPVYPPVPPQG